MISGRFDPRHPHPLPRLLVALQLPDISQNWSAVDFVVDTGAGATCLHPADAIQVVGIDPVMLTDASRWVSSVTYSGIGGGVTYYTTPVVYGLQHDDGQFEFINGTINVAPWRVDNQTLPSLLGWDVLKEFGIFTDWSSGRLELLPKQNP